MLSLDEAIAQEKEAAKEKYIEAMLCHSNPNDEKLDGCVECAKEHEQIAEWLEELKRLKEDIELNRKAMYNKAIDDFASELENHSIYADIGKLDEVKMELVLPVTSIKEVAEQLKAGGENE